MKDIHKALVAKLYIEEPNLLKRLKRMRADLIDAIDCLCTPQDDEGICSWDSLPGLLIMLDALIATHPEDT